MAKHRLQRTRIHAMRYLALATLVVGLGISTGWPQQSTGRSAPGAGTAQTRTPSGRSAKTPAQHKSTTDSSSNSLTGGGKRDPFKLPDYSTGKGGATDSEGFTESLPAGGVLPAGKRGLIISQLHLQGTVRQQTSNKMTAMVVDQRRLAYFLHENDSVYNGVVSKITPDSVYFKENVLDSKGRVTTREVVKRLGAAPGEGR